jgi:hypothetical protein
LKRPQIQISVITATYEPLQGVCVFQVTESTAALTPATPPDLDR